MKVNLEEQKQLKTDLIITSIIVLMGTIAHLLKLYF